MASCASPKASPVNEPPEQRGVDPDRLLGAHLLTAVAADTQRVVVNRRLSVLGALPAAHSTALGSTGQTLTQVPQAVHLSHG